METAKTWQGICSRPTFVRGLRVGLVLLLALAAAPGIASAANSCPADLDGDGSVGSSDLTTTLGCWGPVTTPACAAADFNSDRDVGCFDLEYVLGNWGACGCFGDLDGDGNVGSSDLVILLGDWGTDCRFDLTQNGIVDQSDIDALFCLWGSSGPLGDFDKDGTVGSSDLTLLLAAFGTNCQSDLDRDGIVGDGDLDLLIDAWGPCP